MSLASYHCSTLPDAGTDAPAKGMKFIPIRSESRRRLPSVSAYRKGNAR